MHVVPPGNLRFTIGWIMEQHATEADAVGEHQLCTESCLVCTGLLMQANEGAAAE